MTDENNQIKFFLYENWARTKTGQHTVLRLIFTVTYKHSVFPAREIFLELSLSRSSQCFGSASEPIKLQETIYPVLVVARTVD